MISTRCLGLTTTLLLAAAALVACGGSDDGGGGGSGDELDYTELYATARVCNGEANADAPALAGGAVGTGYKYIDEGWRFGGFEALTDRDTFSPDTEAGFVVCATVVSSEEARRCEFEDEGDEFTLIQMNATYDVEIRATTTAEVVRQAQLDASEDDCPMFTSWTRGEGERQSYADPGESLTQLLDEALAG